MAGDENEAGQDRGGKGSKAAGGSGGGQQTNASGKPKDLSHVPCKFYKVGSCTAGAACPFSHTMAEPGQKDVCAWFVKGNCKFAHKCALAHVLPGQPMSMDRKNKKSAQMASGSSGGRDSKSKSRKTDSISRSNDKPGGSLLGGSTAPTRLLSRSNPTTSTSDVLAKGGPTLFSKAAAPAPPVVSKDGELSELINEDDTITTPVTNNTKPSFSDIVNDRRPAGAPSSSAAAPTNNAIPAKAPAHSTNQQMPIGGTPASPFHKTPISPSRMNGFSPGTSPSTGHLGNGNLSTSPFSSNAGGVFLSRSPTSGSGGGRFMSSTYSGEGLLSSRLGSGAGAASSSLGAGNWASPPSAASSGAKYSVVDDRSPLDEREGENADGDGDANGDEGGEDFVPSSLSDLLTPEEMKRRMQGYGPKKPQMSVRASEGEDTIRRGLAQSNLSGAGTPQGSSVMANHRHSRSVPSQSFLGDSLRSIWGQNPDGTNGASGIPPPLPSSPSGPGGIMSASPSASRFFTSSNSSGTPMDPSKPVGLSGLNSSGLSSAASMGSSFGGSYGAGGHLSPSNASAAFLQSTGLHASYAKNRALSGNGVNGARGLGMFGSSQQIDQFGGGSTNHTPQAPSNLSNMQMHTSSGEFFPSRQQQPGAMPPTSRPSLPNTHSHLGIMSPPANHGLQQHQQHAHHPPSAFNASFVGSGGGGIPGGDGGLLSPGSRALQNHAPGQSLPQGLAAGYSRIHALPPPPPLPLNSPGSARALNSAGVGSIGTAGSPSISATFGSAGGGDWASMVENNGFFAGQQSLPSHQQPPMGTNSGTTPTKQNNQLDAMLSKLSYSQAAAATRSGAGPGQQGHGSGVSPFTPPQVARTASGSGAPKASPLGQESTKAVSGVGGSGGSGGDDDDLFMLDS